MSTSRYIRTPYNEETPPPRTEYERGMYRRDNSAFSGRPPRSQSPHQRHSPPAHDRQHVSNDGELRIKGASIQDEAKAQGCHYDESRRSEHPRARGPALEERSPDRTYDDSRSTYPQRSRAQSRSPRRTRSPGPERRLGQSPSAGPPSRELILEGLLSSITEDDITYELQKYYHVGNLDDVRVIRDRQTRSSRCFGFIRFPSVGAAKAFMTDNSSGIYLYGDSRQTDDISKVRVAYSREREDLRTRDDGEWTCKICTFLNFSGRTHCHRCQTSQMDVDMYTAALSKPQFVNNGDSDVSPDGTPSQYLLIRNLESSVTEDLLAKGIAKLYKPNTTLETARTVNKKGPTKILSTTGDHNLGACEGTLRRVFLVRDLKTDDSWRYGFAEFASVDDARAAMARYDSFEKFTISSKPVLVDYIHAGVFVPSLDSSSFATRYTFASLNPLATRLRYWDEGAWASELTVTDAQAESASGLRDISSMRELGTSGTDAKAVGTPADAIESASKKRRLETKSASKTKKIVPAHLQFWSNRHAELHGVKPSSEISTDGHKDAQQDNPDESALDTLPKESFADPIKKCCYLCSRQFKHENELYKHERLSELHRKNLEDEGRVAKAQGKMNKIKSRLANSFEPVEDEYRDRAKERRRAFNTSKKVSSRPKQDADDSDDNAEADAAPVPSKGASLLGKMGWSAGEGLGANGTGRTAPIATDMYAQGVGLGAQGGKIEDATEEASRNTKSDYGEFLARTKDKAKERFQQMN